MSIDLNVLRKDLEAHKNSLKNHIEDDQLESYRRLFGVDAYVLKVNDYKNSIDQLNMIISLFDSDIIKEAFEQSNIKIDIDDLKRKNMSNQKIIDLVENILIKLNEHKIFLDKINITISD